MSYKRELVIKSIADNLAFSSKSISLENAISLFDSNKVAQDFFRDLFNEIFDYKLVNLDKLNTGSAQPAIDLADADARIAFQITTDSSRKKIQDTIEKFIRHNLQNDYDRLVVFIIGKKLEYRQEFNTNDIFSFDRKSDIWDDNDLIKEIDRLDLEKLERIAAYLQDSLIEFKFPDRLFPQDIENALIFLEMELMPVLGSPDLEQLDTSLLPSRRDDEYISRKNIINSISWDFFVQKIRGHLDYNSEIHSYLFNPINKDMRDKYFRICNAVQNYFSENRDLFSSFEDVFKKIFRELSFYDSTVSDNKVRILLHNMYFNCDIGDKPPEL